MSPRFYCLLLVLTLFLGAQGKSPVKGRLTQRIQHLLNVTEAEKKFSNVLETYIASDPTLGAYKSEIMKFINTFLSFQSLRPHVVEIYRDLYTIGDINGLIKFYTSPLGKKLLDKESQAEARLSQLIQKKLQDQMPQITRGFNRSSTRIYPWIDLIKPFNENEVFLRLSASAYLMK